MSSSDDVLGWQAFREREVPAPVDLLSPASELSAALQRCWHDLDAERATGAEAGAEACAAAAEQAVLVFRLSAVLDRNEGAMTEAGLGDVHRQLRIVRDQLLDGLRRNDLHVIDPIGQPFDEVADEVRVAGWRHGQEFAGEVVAETIEPIIKHGGDPVRLGRVIMGAPATGSAPGKENA
jgi:molecular chaperone GrpE (heat shock protein)